MSLYIGNMSSRIRRDELEREFQRFGRCSVRMKDGYGFVVYEFPPNAEKALRALQKRNICGESLTLTWSNKQPRAFRRFARADRSYGPQHGKDSARGGNYAKQKLSSNDRQDYEMTIMQQDNGGIIGSAYMLDEETVGHETAIKDHVREEHHDREAFQDGHGGEPDLVDDDRWGKQFCDPSNNEVGNQIEFDRYKPDQGYDRKTDGEYQRIAYSGDSPGLRSSQEKTRRDHISEAMFSRPHDSKFQQTCYNCGRIGHKMRNCPQVNGSRRRVSKFDQKHDDVIDRRGRDMKNDIKPSGSGKHRKLIWSEGSPMLKQVDRSLKRDYGGKKRGRKESPKRHKTKKSRWSISSLPLSDCIASISHPTSESSKSTHVLRSRSLAKSKSVSSRSRSLSSNSRSKSTSHFSRSKSSKSRPRSSSPTSMSLSVSTGRHLPSSSNKAQLDMKGCSDNVTALESKEILSEQGFPLEGDSVIEVDDSKNRMEEVHGENALSSFKGRNEMQDNTLQKDDPGNQIVSLPFYEVTTPSIPLAEKGKLTTESIFPEILVDTEDYPNSDSLTAGHMPISLKNLDSEVPLSSSHGHSTRITSEELQMILKHYGLNLPDENDRQLPVDAYFGSARLWPWEIIYYRRLKKGPISVENYARRVDQNREFSITDRYIRSSSGWGELEQENL